MYTMKSSTIRRSNLSKEKIAVLEALSKFNGSGDAGNVNDAGINNEPVEDGSPEIYVRQNKEKELDLLWKDFKMPKGERSPIVYLGIGFVSGIIATLLVSAFISVSSGNFHTSLRINKPAVATEATTTEASTSEIVAEEETDNAVQEESEQKSAKKFGIFTSQKSGEETSTEDTASQVNKEYEVQSGDTMERIVRNFYGSYSEDKVDAVMKANNMTDPNKLSIGQKLVIPNN